MAYAHVENWMSEIKDDTLLQNMTIPGTHDSAAKGSILPFANCQEYSIDDQLRFGVRFLDIRLKYEDGKFKCYHGSADLDLTFPEVISKCKSFLNYFKEETIIMSIKNEDEGGDDLNIKVTDEFDTNIRPLLADASLWYSGNTLPSLGSVRSRMVIVRRWKSNESFGIDASSWNSQTEPTFSIQIPNCTMLIQDDWDGPPPEKKWASIKNWLTTASTRPADGRSWFINFLSASDWKSGIGPGSYAIGYTAAKGPFKWVEGMNPRLETFLEGRPGSSCRYGTVLIDFIGRGPYASIAPRLIRSNRMYEKDLWSNWAVGNAAGFSNLKLYSPLKINAMRGIEQSGYGLINMQLGFLYPDQTQGWTEWDSENHGDNSSIVGPVTVPAGQHATGIQVWNQQGFGLVDACLVYGESGNETARLTNNSNGTALSAVSVPTGADFLGFQTQEQWGYGLIDLRIFGVDRPS